MQLPPAAGNAERGITRIIVDEGLSANYATFILGILLGLVVVARSPCLVVITTLDSKPIWAVDFIIMSAEIGRAG